MMETPIDSVFDSNINSVASGAVWKRRSLDRVEPTPTGGAAIGVWFRPAGECPAPDDRTGMKYLSRLAV